MIHLCLLNVDVPAVAQSVLGQVIELVVFDPIPLEDEITELFELEHQDDNELSSNFQ